MTLIIRLIIGGVGMLCIISFRLITSPFFKKQCCIKVTYKCRNISASSPCGLVEGTFSWFHRKSFSILFLIQLHLTKYQIQRGTTVALITTVSFLNAIALYAYFVLHHHFIFRDYPDSS